MVACLDWGLGHATRCIPLIKCLSEKDFTIIFAGNKQAETIIREIFPTVLFLPLKGYEIAYTQNKRFLPIKILWQTPKILLSILHENKWLQHTIKKHSVDIVISDNRYGLFSKKAYCIFMTHQLRIHAKYVWLENVLQKINYRFINRFSACWVADFEKNFIMAGQLSHPKKMPVIPVNYTGLLSRFQKKYGTQLKYKYLILISGPEPQRSILESKIMDVLPLLHGDILVLLGKPGEENLPAKNKNAIIKNHLSFYELQDAMNAAEYIICRSGYSSVMEILALQKKSILIPTPGQTEQEYLAVHLKDQNLCFSFQQQENFYEQILAAQSFGYQLPGIENNELQKVVSDLAERFDN